MDNIRVYELSKEFGISNTEILNIAKSLGIQVKSHASSLTPEDTKRIKDEIKENSNFYQSSSSEKADMTNEQVRVFRSEVGEEVVERRQGERVVLRRKKKLEDQENIEILNQEKIEIKIYNPLEGLFMPTIEDIKFANGLGKQIHSQTNILSLGITNIIRKRKIIENTQHWGRLLQIETKLKEYLESRDEDKRKGDCMVEIVNIHESLYKDLKYWIRNSTKIDPTTKDDLDLHEHLDIFNTLDEYNLLPTSEIRDLEYYRKLRNKTVHGYHTPTWKEVVGYAFASYCIFLYFVTQDVNSVKPE